MYKIKIFYNCTTWKRIHFLRYSYVSITCIYHISILIKIRIKLLDLLYNIKYYVENMKIFLMAKVPMLINKINYRMEITLMLYFLTFYSYTLDGGSQDVYKFLLNGQ